MNPTLILVLNWEEHLNLLTNIWLKSTWMNASNNDDIGGLEIRIQTAVRQISLFSCELRWLFFVSKNLDPQKSFTKFFILAFC